jgi:hypothetical protein
MFWLFRVKYWLLMNELYNSLFWVLLNDDYMVSQVCFLTTPLILFQTHSICIWLTLGYLEYSVHPVFLWILGHELHCFQMKLLIFTNLSTAFLFLELCKDLDSDYIHASWDTYCSFCGELEGLTLTLSNRFRRNSSLNPIQTLTLWKESI